MINMLVSGPISRCVRTDWHRSAHICVVACLPVFTRDLDCHLIHLRHFESVYFETDEQENIALAWTSPMVLNSNFYDFVAGLVDIGPAARRHRINLSAA